MRYILFLWAFLVSSASYTASSKQCRSVNEACSELDNGGEATLASYETYTNSLQDGRVTRCQRRSSKRSVRLTLEDGTIELSEHHVVYIPKKKLWKSALHLRGGDSLLDSTGSSVAITAVEIFENETEIFEPTVEHTQCYFYSDRAILVHNMPLMVIPLVSVLCDGTIILAGGMSVVNYVLYIAAAIGLGWITSKLSKQGIDCVGTITPNTFMPRQEYYTTPVAVQYAGVHEEQIRAENIYSMRQGFDPYADGYTEHPPYTRVDNLFTQNDLEQYHQHKATQQFLNRASAYAEQSTAPVLTTQQPYVLHEVPFSPEPKNLYASDSLQNQCQVDRGAFKDISCGTGKLLPDAPIGGCGTGKLLMPEPPLRTCGGKSITQKLPGIGGWSQYKKYLQQLEKNIRTSCNHAIRFYRRRTRIIRHLHHYAKILQQSTGTTHLRATAAAIVRNGNKKQQKEMAKAARKGSNQQPRGKEHASTWPEDLDDTAVYKDADYHHINSSGQKSPSPKDGLKSLSESIKFTEKNGKQTRVAVQAEDEFVILQETTHMPRLEFHGHTVPFEILKNDYKAAKTLLTEKKLISKKGKLLK